MLVGRGVSGWWRRRVGTNGMRIVGEGSKEMECGMSGAERRMVLPAGQSGRTGRRAYLYDSTSQSLEISMPNHTSRAPK